MIRIAIDGPGGAGKSSVARRVAKELGIIYVDTGALYRNIGLFMLRIGVSPSDAEAVTAALERITLELKFDNGKQIILLNGVDEGDKIRTPEVSMAASAVSAIKEVRAYLLNMQRDTAKKNSVIMDGRDIGTVILPNAEVKIFLTASPEARAERRYKELLAKGSSVTYESVYNEMVERDKNDSTRDIAPCVQAEDALLLDNSNLTEEETVKAVLKIVKKKSKAKSFPLYTFAKIFIAPFYNFFTRTRSIGRENVPKEGGVIFCPNHISALDIVSLAAICPRKLTFVAKKELFSMPVIGFIIRKFGAIKVDRGTADISAIRASVEAAQSGRVLTIFPQGHRYPGVDPATTKVHHGAAMIAYHSKCPVVPVGIKVKNAKYGFLKRIRIIYGKPISYEELGFVNGGRDEYELATKKIFDEIIKLCDYSDLPPYSPDSAKKKK